MFPSKIRRRGKQYYRDRAVQRIEVHEPGTHYVVYVEGTELYEVDALYDHGEWLTECTCPYGVDCKHAYAALQNLLDIASGKANVSPEKKASKTPSTPPPPARPSALRKAFERAKGKPASKREIAYLKQVTDLYESLRPDRADPQVAWLEKLGVFSPLRSWGSVKIWLEFPEDDFKFWLYALNHHLESDRRSAEFGRDIPDFMGHVSDLSPIAANLKRMNRAREIDGWRDFFCGNRALILADGEAAQRQENELRLCLKPEFAALEIRRPGAADFRILSLADFKALTDRYKPNRLPFDTRSELLLRRMDHKAYFGNSHRLRREDPEDMRALHNILSSPTLRGAIVNSSGEPFAWPAEKLIWNVREDEKDGSAYRAEITLENGDPIAGISFALSGTPGYYVVGSRIHEGPPFDPRRLDPQKGATLPREAVEHAVGLEFFHRVGARLPEELANRIEDVQLRLRLTCRLRRDHNEQCELIAQAVDDAGTVLETWRQDEWQTELRALPEIAPDESPDPAEKVRVLGRSALSVVPGIFDSIGASFNWQHGLSIQVNRNFPKRFSEWLEVLPDDIEIVLEGELAAFNQPATAGSLRLEIEETGIDWFDLKVELDIEDNDLTDEEIELLLNAKGDWVRLDDKGWRRLAFELSEEDDEQLASLGLNPRQMSSEPQRIHALQLASPAAQEFLPEEQAEQLRNRVNEIQARVTPEVPKTVTAKLRPYQIEGFHFLAYLSENRFGGILADDMGLGKTLQTLAWIAWLRERSETGPCLVVCPKSVMDNWHAETGRFTPGLKARVWHRAAAKELPKRADEADIHIINYAALRKLGEALKSISFTAVILDEGQNIKNPSSQTAKAACALVAEHRLILTGTPIENRLMDLWSLLAFAMPGVLGGQRQFGKLYNAKDDPFARLRLSSRVRPFLLRRTKSQVAQDLPDRIEEDLYCEIEGEQRKLYDAERKRARQLLLGVKTQKQLNQLRFNFLTSLLRLRQICCHPKLIRESSRAKAAKLESLLELAEPLMEEGVKLLVFSQFVEALDLIEAELKKHEWPIWKLTGSTENRGALVDEFQAHEGAGIFLISLKAGGAGLNLTAASYVVLFDPWWNPAVENQAIDRTHRIGQTDKVIAYRLLIKNTVEEKIRELQKQKQALAEDVLGEEKFSQSLTVEDFQFLLED